MADNRKNRKNRKDRKDRKRGSKARKAPISGTRYTDAELNAPVRGFPPAAEIWNADRTDPILLNPEQLIDTFAEEIEGERVKGTLDFYFFKFNGEIVVPYVVMLRAHLLLRRYKTNVSLQGLKLSVGQGAASAGLFGWHLSPHDKRRSVALLNVLYGSNAIKFRADACALYQAKFSEWLSRRASSRCTIRSISSTDSIVEQLSTECSIIECLRRALGDAETSAGEWPSILSGKHVPSLNKLHRIGNPQKDGVRKMTNDEMFITSFVVSFFGCVNASQIYPKLIGSQEVFQILCFFGRINFGELSPTVYEAQAYLKHSDGAFSGEIWSAAGDILNAADNLCGWTKFKAVLVDLCRMTIEAHEAGRSLPPRFGRLWPMV